MTQSIAIPRDAPCLPTGMGMPPTAQTHLCGSPPSRGAGIDGLGPCERAAQHEPLTVNISLACSPSWAGCGLSPTYHPWTLNDPWAD